MRQSAWRDAATDPPTLTGKILVWVNGVGPAIVTVEEDYMSYWDGEDESELTTPEDWDFWMRIVQPNT